MRIMGHRAAWQARANGTNFRRFAAVLVQFCAGILARQQRFGIRRAKAAWKKQYQPKH